MPPDPDRPRRLREFLGQLERDPATARADAARAARLSGRLPFDDPRRAIALECHLLASVRADAGDAEWLALEPVAASLVEAWRAIGDAGALASALGLQAIVLVGRGQAERADAALSEALQAWRQALPPGSIELAWKIELHAEHVQKALGRRDLTIELLREALAIRRARPDEQPLRLVEVLQELAIHEMSALHEDEACALQLEAIERLSALAGREADAAVRDEMRAGLAQSLVSMAGLQLARGDDDACVAWLERAAALPLDDAARRLERALLVMQVCGGRFERDGDLAAAIDGWTRLLLDVLEHAPPAGAQRLDPLTPGDIACRLAALHLRAGDVDEAAAALRLARQVLGASEEVMLLRAQLLQAQGLASAARAAYRRALRLRKQQAAEVAVLYGTPRTLGPGPAAAGAPPAYTSDVGERLHLGRADVLVPGGALSASASAPRWDRAQPWLGLATRPDALLLRRVSLLQPQPWREQARRWDRAAQLHDGAALVFVHGFNVAFDAAMKRAAQLRRDLNFDAPVFVYSWPSRGRPWRYYTDRRTALASVEPMVRFLEAVAAATRARRVHVVAHSMGNRIVLPALARAATLPASALAGRIGEVVFAAPAVPVDEFVEGIERLAGVGVTRLTLYASRADRAMNIGLMAEGSVLAGHTADGLPLVHPAVHSIDITDASDASSRLNLNHDVFTSNPVINEDLRLLLRLGRERLPHERMACLRPVDRWHPGGRYWRYDPGAPSGPGAASG